ncbi:MAG: aminotransferase class III-fold pyridoxal phosphate-dependent enzyme [Armatimonadia bacterium]|nr:aminotransferase class III-fold pyridoxal phosphate-dependent enzyme [Armatimonadia bacterium]
MSEQRSYDRSVELYRRAVEAIPGGSQTNSKRANAYAPGAYPIYAQKAEGARVQDVDGNWYIDYVLGLGPITLGYCYPEVDHAIRAQLEKGIIYGQLSPLEVEVAERVCNVVPCAEMVRFLKGGAEVTTAAARLARTHTGREMILNCGYRGWADTWFSQSAGIEKGVPECIGGLVDGWTRHDLESLQAKLEEHAGNVAMVSLDPATGGARVPDGYHQGVRDLCDEHDVLLMYDEIVTGFRMANGGGQEYFGVTPDLACFAKGAANGMPLGIVCGRADVMRHAIEDTVISVTYGGEALSLAAGKAVMQVLQREPVIETIWESGRRLMAGFEELGEKHGVPLHCHGYEPMSSQTIQYEDAELSRDVWTLLLQEMAARGVTLRRGGLLFITYSHRDAEVEETLEALDGALAVIAEAVDEGNVKDLLRVEEVKESFRSFT